MLAWFVACEGEGESGAQCADAPDVTWQGWGEGFFLTYCDGCHASTTEDRRGAPASVTFDTWDQVREQKDTIRRVVLEEETMPVGGGVYESDLDYLDVLLACSE